MGEKRNLKRATNVCIPWNMQWTLGDPALQTDPKCCVHFHSNENKRGKLYSSLKDTRFPHTRLLITHHPLCSFIIIIIIFKVGYTWPVSIQNFNFWNLWIYFGHLVGLFWRGNQPAARPLPTQDNTTQKNADTHIHASSGIRTRDPSVRAVDDSTCLRPRGCMLI
jgi:hypothetical protein